jgi:internalin A
LDFLENLTNLVWLNLESTRLEDLTGLKNLEKLMYLNLSCNTKIKNLDALKNLKNLTFLNLSFCEKLEDLSGIKNLVHLKELYLENCEFIKPGGGKDLKNLQNLEVLEFSLRYRGDDHNLDFLKKFTKLKKLKFFGSQIENLDFLKKLIHLRELDLENMGLEKKIVKMIGKHLINLKVLKMKNHYPWCFDKLTQLEKLHMDRLTYSPKTFESLKKNAKEDWERYERYSNIDTLDSDLEENNETPSSEDNQNGSDSE